jgi:uncharacterized protein (UPF0332 family)
LALSDDLIVTARRLARANPSRPRQADLRRAVSTAYYAVFHALARQCAERFVGTGQNRSRPAWQQVYRALDHGFVKNACFQAANLGFPTDIVTFADIFARLQDERHRADYDPETRYTRADVQALISMADQAVSALSSAPKDDRTAFAALVLLKKRA